jgi:hypothetical protein
MMTLVAEARQLAAASAQCAVAGTGVVLSDSSETVLVLRRQKRSNREPAKG